MAVTAAAAGEATTEATSEPDACPDGEERCGNQCRDLTSDDFHCGACDNPCEPFIEQCIDSVCVEIDCGAGLTNCNGVCVDLQTDPANCGECGIGCVAGVCQGGTCGIVDGGGCVDLGSPCVVGGPACCTGICFDGICQCSPIGYLCAGDGDCCSGSCNDLTGFCD